MKAYTFLVIALLMVALVPMVLADGTETGTEPSVVVGDPNDIPRVCTDSTDRIWNPNDQTYYTAEEYGSSVSNSYGISGYEVSERGNYVFQGETVDYIVLVEDEDGEDDIDTVVLQRNGVGVGSCSDITDAYGSSAIMSNFECDGEDPETFDDETMKLYRCQLVVQAGNAATQSGWYGESDINVKVTDESGANSTSSWTDRLIMNPALVIQLQGGISFGSVEPGETVTSNSVYLKNVGTDGVVMDMYIASDDYFTDPAKPDAICGDGNGIPYYDFSYYATKGSLDSGDNNDAWDGLSGASCSANDDEYTDLPSHSGEIADMCRIINHRKDGSFLAQGQSMSLTFQLDVPEPCEGSFSDGQFHFVGRVV